MGGSEANLSSLTLGATQSGNVSVIGVDDVSGLTSLTLTATTGSTLAIDNMSGDSLYGGPSTNLTIGQSGSIVLQEFQFSNLEGATLTITSSGSGNTLRFASANSSITDFYSTMTVSGSDLAVIMGGSGTLAESTDGGLANQADAMVITTASGADYILGGTGADSIVTGAGADRVDAGAGNDTINVGTDADVVYAGSGNDRITGGSGVQTIYAGGGADSINSGSGADVIYAGSGSDTIVGLGSDIFVFSSGYAAGEVDRISSYTTAMTVDYTASVAVSASNNGLTLASNGTAASNLFGRTAGYDLHVVSFGAGSGGANTAVLDFKTASAFGMLYGTSSNGVDAAFTGSLAFDFGTSATTDGINWATNASGGVAVIALNTGSGDGAGTYLITLSVGGSATTALTTANVIHQVFLAGYTASIGAGGDFT